jgi:hypothetical protein
VTGGGVPVPRFHQLFLLARRQGCRTPENGHGQLGRSCRQVAGCW